MFLIAAKLFSRRPEAVNKLRTILTVLLAIATFAAMVISDLSLCKWEYYGPDHTAKTAAFFAADRSDVPPLLLRSRQCTSLLQTRSYWHEDYTPGIPFYRPLSLTWYWCEYHVLSPDRFARWTTVSIVLDFAFCALLALLVQQLTGSTTAGLFAVFFFSGMICFPYIGQIASALNVTLDDPAFYAVKEWKDQPTILSDSAALCAMIFALKRHWAAGLTAALVSVLFKESGWITFLLTFLLLWHSGQVQTMPRWVYIGAGFVMLIPMLARYSSGMGLIGGYYVGQNYEWRVRYINGVCGTFLNGPLHGWWTESLLGVVIFAIFRSKLPVIAKLSVTLALTGLFILLISAIHSMPLDLALSRILDYKEGLPFIAQGLILACAITCLINYPALGKTAAVLCLLSLIAALPFVAALQVNTHALNMCFALQAAVAGIAVVSICRSGSDYVGLRLARSTGDIMR